ncbi:MAG TPA: purine-nucleoside phosphorylase [Acidimicrobiales bacterium]|nr:purine-nucleoside phosphorylase [Acidimicrobiales bacterium]
MTSDPYALAESAAAALVAKTDGVPHAATVVLGSGWQSVADALGTTKVELEFRELPGFTVPTVAGHEGVIRSIEVGNRRVLVQIGRVHLYEGRTASEVVHPIRVAVLAGSPVVVLTNAAGGLDAAIPPGEAVLIRDQINLTGRSPLTGPPPPAPYGAPSVDLTALYPAELRELAHSVDPSLAEGVYAGVIGPQYETPAEIAMLRGAGVQLVGMSTVLEAIAARHLGASVLGVSLVTNHAAGVGKAPIAHRDVLAVGATAAPRLGELIAGILGRL